MKERSPTEKMRILMVSLPTKDIPFGLKFLKERNFESLQELVDSAIIKVRRSQATDNPKEEYKNVDLRSLSRLKIEVDSYVAILDVSQDSNEEDDYLLEEFNEYNY